MTQETGLETHMQASLRPGLKRRWGSQYPTRWLEGPPAEGGRGWGAPGLGGCWQLP